MTRLLSFAVLAVLAGALGAPSARADTTPFVFQGGFFQDEKEVPISAPEGVACDDAGNVVVSDTGNGRLVYYKYLRGSPSLGTAVKVPGLVSPTRSQFDSKGNLYVLDGKSRRIFKLDPKGVMVGALDPKGGPSTTLPVAFKLDASDNLYVVDAVGNKLLVLDPGGAVTRQVDLPKGLSGLKDVFVDVGGSAYVVDGVTASLWVLERGATAFKAFTPGMKDKMNFPTYLTGRGGRLFLVDQYGNGIVVLGADGAYQGRQLAIGWGDGSLYYPAQLCINAAGEAFIADRGNNRVQVFGTSR